MPRDLPEADWKACRKLRAVALDRFCARIIDEVETIASNNDDSYHARYIEIFKFIERRDHDIAQAFNDSRRSNIVLQFAVIVSHGLVSRDELQCLSPKTRETIDALSKHVG